MKANPEILRAGLASNRLYLILLATEACNFRCFYCYEEFRHDRMEAFVLNGIKNLLSRRADDLDDLNLSWFGGEPLLAMDRVEAVQRHVCSLAEKRPRLRFHANMTTNGYLLSRKVFENLLDLKVTAYHITFDGPREWHNRKRVLADGRGTFDRIWQNLTALREVPGAFNIVLRVQVDKENLNDIPGFIDQCGETFGSDPRFELFIRPLSRFGGSNDDLLCILDKKEQIQGIQSLRKRAADQGLVRETKEDPVQVCYAATGNSFVIRADGRLDKCSVALKFPKNHVGRLNEDGTLILEKPRMLQWMRGLYSGDAKELRCPLAGFP